MTGEPRITINGVTLSEGQAATLRVAMNSFLVEMREPDALGDDAHGRPYARRRFLRGRTWTTHAGDHEAEYREENPNPTRSWVGP